MLGKESHQTPNFDRAMVGPYRVNHTLMDRVDYDIMGVLIYYGPQLIPSLGMVSLP